MNYRKPIHFLLKFPACNIDSPLFLRVWRRGDRVEQRAEHLDLTTSPLSPFPAHLDKCATRQIRLCTIGQDDQKETQIVSARQTHVPAFFPISYLYVYLLIDPICAYLISPSIFLSRPISPSLSASPSIWADTGA